MPPYQYISTAKCELLKPFFVETTAIKKPIKDYIEVNSAIALALEGLGLGHSEMNFKIKGGAKDLSANMNLGNVSDALFGGNFMEFGSPLKGVDKLFVRLAACLLVAIVGYGIISNTILEQIDDKRKEIKREVKEVSSQIEKIETQTTQISNAEEQYKSLIESLTAVEDDENTETTTEPEKVRVPKDAIPNLMNRIVHVIPTKVKLTSIKNTDGKHIVIVAEANKYEQLGYFKAVLDVNGVLENVKSSSSVKSGDTISITIEGDLP